MPGNQKVSFEETLGKHVLPSLCIGCGSCVIVCPFGCLEYSSGKPVLAKECQSCGICPRICPKYGLSMPDLERFVFGRERNADEAFGIYRRMVIAQTKNEEIRKVCQDGGVVTTLLAYAIEKGIIDGAVLSGVSEVEPLRAIPKLATTTSEVIESAGTRYTYSPNMLALKEGVLQKKRSLGFVGTPCQIQAVRKIQAVPLRRYSNALSFTIGVFCSECFNYDGLVKELIEKELSVDPSEVKKMNIKGGLLITTESGGVKTLPLKEMKEYACNCVSACSDFSAELADISAGGLGLEGFTFTVLRTDGGEELFEKAQAEGLIRSKPIEEGRRALDLLVRLSERKRKGAARLTF